VIKKKYLIIIISLILVMVESSMFAKKKRLPNCLKSIVIFEQRGDDIVEDEKNILSGTGFITTYNNKKVVITNLNIIYKTVTPVIKTIDGIELKYVKTFIAKDKRNVIMFELSEDDNSSDILVPLALETDVSGNIDIDDRVISFGCKSNLTTITWAKGKVIGVGPVNIELSSRIPYNMNGGPILSKNSGKVIGCVSTKLRNKKNKRKKSKVAEGTRIDSIKDTVEIDAKLVEKDIAKLKARKKLVKKMEACYEKYLLYFEDVSKRVKKECGTTNISMLKKKYDNTMAQLKAYQRKIKTSVDFEFPYFQRFVNDLPEQGMVIIENFEEVEEKFEKIEKAKEKSRKKNDLKKF